MITENMMKIINSNPDMLYIINLYMQDDMKKLKKICHKIWIGKVNISEYEDLYDVATDCLMETVINYDSEKSGFETFLTGNIIRKSNTWFRDTKYTLKSNNLLRDKKGKIVRDEHKRPIRIENISFDAPTEDESDLKNIIPGTFNNLFDELFYEDLSDIKIKKYINKLSNVQKEILIHILNGYKADEIQELLHMSSKEYSQNLTAIQAYENVRELM